MRRKTPEQLMAERAARGAKFEPPPLFTEAAPEGKCPDCKGSQFRQPLVSRWGAGLSAGIWEARKLVDCVTCGKRFRRG